MVKFGDSILLIWRNRDLAWQFSKRVILERTRGSVLGTLWQLLTPLLMMGLYTLVFGVLFKGSFHPDKSENSLVYGIGIYIGLSILNILNETLGQAGHAILGSPNLVKKVVFPLELLPLTSAAFPLVQSVVGLILAGISLTIIGYPADFHWFLIPVLVAPIIMMSVGIAWMVGSLSVYFKDLVHVIGLLTQVLFWSSGIFYAAHAVQAYPAAWMVLKWNPVLLVIEEVRNVMLWGADISIKRMVYAYCVGFVLWFFGFELFKRLKRGFADIM